MTHKKILITAGGTGGHIYPAVGLAKQLGECEILFAGGKLSTNKFFSNSGYNFKEVSCANLPFSKPWKIPLSLFRIVQGVYQSLNVIKQYNPSVVVGFGSFYTLPILIAAKLKRIPIVLHEQNRPLGKVNRYLAPYVDAVCVHFPDTSSKIPLEVVGMPLRKGFKKGSLSRDEAFARYGLNPKILTILAFGGSQGAQKLNELIFQATKELKRIPKFQIIHFTGEKSSLTKAQYDALGIPSYVAAFEPQMEYAWHAADIVVSRSGACTIAEQIEFEVPGVLVPFPYATDLHQDSNAEFAAEKVGFATVIREAVLTPKILAEAITETHATLTEKKEKARKYKASRKNKDFKEIVLTQANKKN